VERKGKNIIVIAGPTAVGKTSVAIVVAQHFNTEIISADSRQFFREMNIGTAKPTKVELGKVKHHFVGHISVEEKYNAGDFQRDAILKLDSLFTQHDVVVIVGGSGLYIKAVCEGFDEFPEVNIEIRESIAEAYKNHGISWLQSQLETLDPIHFEKVDRWNPQRMMRALEVCISSEKPYSSFLTKKKKQAPFNFNKIALDVERAELHRRIENRVDRMIESGLAHEVKQLLKYQNLNALQTVGYREIVQHFEGEYDLATAIELIKRNTRRFARKQITWFKKDGEFKWFSPNEEEKILTYIKTWLDC